MESTVAVTFGCQQPDSCKSKAGLSFRRNSPVDKTAPATRHPLPAHRPRCQLIGLISKAGRYGGTYAHKDIAFEFGNLESLDAGFIHMSPAQADRIAKLNAIAIRQMRTLTANAPSLLETKSPDNGSESS